MNASNLYLGQKSPWTNVSLDKSLLGLMSLGQNCPWTTVPWTNVATPKLPSRKSFRHFGKYSPLYGHDQNIGSTEKFCLCDAEHL